MAFIDIIQHEAAEGQLKHIYDSIKKWRGKLAEVHKILSHNPDAILAHMDLYMTILYGNSPLKRYQREMMAVVVSALNQCEYCVMHHIAALGTFWKDEKKLKQLQVDYTKLDMPEMDKCLCKYASELTQNPSKINQEEHISRLKAAGLSDRAITDAALVISYFNFVNRLVFGLGVQKEADKGEGYFYDWGS